MNKRRQNEAMSLLLLLVLFVFSGLTAGKLVGYAMNNSSPRSALEANSCTKESTEENLKKYREQNKEVAGALKDKNLFYEPPKPPGPPTVCQAIFGDEAYIQYEGNFKWYKVGDKIGEHGKLTGIEATYVKIDWKGQESKLAPIAAAESSGPKPASAKSPSSKGPKKPRTGIRPVVKKGKGITAKTASVGGEDLSWFDADVSPETRAKLERMWAILPDEMKEEAKQNWLKMSDEEKEKAIKDLENMPDNMDEMMEEQMRRNR